MSDLREAAVHTVKDTKARRLLLRLQQQGKPFSQYDPYSDSIVVIGAWDYQVPSQWPAEPDERLVEIPLVLFEETGEDAGMKPIVGFQIKNAESVCRKYGLPFAEERVTVSQILAALGTENIGIGGEVAIHMAMELVRKHDLDKIEFPE